VILFKHFVVEIIDLAIILCQPAQNVCSRQILSVTSQSHHLALFYFPSFVCIESTGTAVLSSQIKMNTASLHNLSSTELLLNLSSGSLPGSVTAVSSPLLAVGLFLRREEHVQDLAGKVARLVEGGLPDFGLPPRRNGRRLLAVAARRLLAPFVVRLRLLLLRRRILLSFRRRRRRRLRRRLRLFGGSGDSLFHLGVNFVKLFYFVSDAAAK